jgi:Phosphotransferase enzyme family
MDDFEEQKVTEYTDGDLLRYIKASPYLPPENRVRHISPNLVSKQVGKHNFADEVAGLELAKRLGIRVPDIQRVVHDEHVVYLIMDFVPGMMLQTSWTELGWVATFRMAFQLRGYVRSMRQRKSITAGGLVTGIIGSIWLDDTFGLPPHSTPKAVNSFLSFWLQYSRERARSLPTLETYRLTSHLVPAIPKSFVFSHQDLAPRNLLVDKKNNLWIIDWGMSGWYPDYFEYVGMQNFNSSTWGWMSRLRWWVFSWISVGIFRKERKSLELVRMCTTTDQFARSILPEFAEELRMRGMYVC